MQERAGRDRLRFVPQFMRLSFRLPVSGASIDAVGTVAWVSEKRQGIQFATLSAPAQESIRRIAEVEKE